MNLKCLPKKSTSLRLPQYLIKAMLIGAWTTTRLSMAWCKLRVLKIGIQHANYSNPGWISRKRIIVTNFSATKKTECQARTEFHTKHHAKMTNWVYKPVNWFRSSLPKMTSLKRPADELTTDDPSPKQSRLEESKNSIVLKKDTV
jgi:hypothetical protein